MVALGDVLFFAGVPERIAEPANERFVTVRMNGLGAVRRSIGVGKTPVPFTGYRVRAGQLIYSRIDARNGAFALVPRELDGAVVSKDFPVFDVQTDRAVPDYLMHFLRSGVLQRDFRAASFGATNRQRISENRFLTHSIPLPPLAEQRRIAAILDQADALQAKRRQTLTLLDDLTQAVFLDMFGDPLANPEGWPMAELGDLGIWQSGGTPPRSSKAYFDGSVPWFSSGELGPLLTRDSREHISESALVETSAKAVAPGSLMLGMYDTAALKASIASTWVSCNQAVAFAQLDTSHANVIYVYFAIQIGKERLKRLQRGIRQKNLNLSLIRSISIALPPLPAQDKFATVIDHIKIQRETGDFARATEEELRSSLRDQLFSSSLEASKCSRKGIDGGQPDCAEAARGSTSVTAHHGRAPATMMGLN